MVSRVTSYAVAVLSLLAASQSATIASAMAGPFMVDANAWVIGPVIKGRNYSVGMPLHPTRGPNASFSLELPRAPRSVHYVTFPYGSLTGKSRIVMRYRVETAPGARVHASTAPGEPGIITPFFQRDGDNWTGRGSFETFRWYATFPTKELTPGEHVLVAPLNSNWTAVMTSSARSNPTAFREALADPHQVGFVLGSGPIKGIPMAALI